MFAVCSVGREHRSYARTVAKSCEFGSSSCGSGRDVLSLAWFPAQRLWASLIAGWMTIRGARELDMHEEHRILILHEPTTTLGHISRLSLLAQSFIITYTERHDRFRSQDSDHPPEIKPPAEQRAFPTFLNHRRFRPLNCAKRHDEPTTIIRRT